MTSTGVEERAACRVWWAARGFVVSLNATVRLEQPLEARALARVENVAEDVRRALVEWARRVPALRLAGGGSAMRLAAARAD